MVRFCFVFCKRLRFESRGPCNCAGALLQPISPPPPRFRGNRFRHPDGHERHLLSPPPTKPHVTHGHLVFSQQASGMSFILSASSIKGHSTNSGVWRLLNPDSSAGCKIALSMWNRVERMHSATLYLPLNGRPSLTRAFWSPSRFGSSLKCDGEPAGKTYTWSPTRAPATPTTVLPWKHKPPGVLKFTKKKKNSRRRLNFFLFAWSCIRDPETPRVCVCVCVYAARNLLWFLVWRKWKMHFLISVCRDRSMPCWKNICTTALVCGWLLYREWYFTYEVIPLQLSPQPSPLCTHSLTPIQPHTHAHTHRPI